MAYFSKCKILVLTEDLEILFWEKNSSSEKVKRDAVTSLIPVTNVGQLAAFATFAVTFYAVTLCVCKVTTDCRNVITLHTV